MKEDIITKEIKSSEYDIESTLKLFEKINDGVRIEEHSILGYVIFTDIDPTLLLYPEGWYFNSGLFTNRNNYNEDKYQEIIFLTTNGEFWAGRLNIRKRDLK